MSELMGKQIHMLANAPQVDRAATSSSMLLPTRIEPIKRWGSIGFKELWEFRELLYFFVWRDIKVRYKQTVMGMLWGIIQPLFTMIIFSLFFGGLAGVPSDGLPYPIFSFTALVPWTFFANALSLGSNSLVSNASMIKKIYFPRLMMPAATVLAGLVDFVIAFIFLLGIMLFYGIKPTSNIIWLPFFLVLTVITSLGVSLWLAAMNVHFRDVRYVVPFLVQAWMFITPIAYPSSMLSQPWLTLYSLNPMAGVVEGFRWALLGTDTAPGPMIVVSSLAALGIFVGGIFYFRYLEQTFADVI
jgi:lipopolysaccharide transport system permease protein